MKSESHWVWQYKERETDIFSEAKSSRNLIQGVTLKVGSSDLKCRRSVDVYHGEFKATNLDFSIKSMQGEIVQK